MTRLPGLLRPSVGCWRAPPTGQSASGLQPVLHRSPQRSAKSIATSWRAPSAPKEARSPRRGRTGRSARPCAWCRARRRGELRWRHHPQMQVHSCSRICCASTRSVSPRSVTPSPPPAATAAAGMRVATRPSVIRSLGLPQHRRHPRRGHRRANGKAGTHQRRGRGDQMQARAALRHRPFNDRDDAPAAPQMTTSAQRRQDRRESQARVDEVNARSPQGYRLRPIYQRPNWIGHTVIPRPRTRWSVPCWSPPPCSASATCGGHRRRGDPLSLLFAFILMHAMGVSANLISPRRRGLRGHHRQSAVMVEALMVRSSPWDAYELLASSSRRSADACTPSSRPRPSWVADHVLEGHHHVAFPPIFTFQRSRADYCRWP